MNLEAIGSIELDRTYPMKPTIKIFDKQSNMLQSKTVAPSEAEKVYAEIIKNWTQHLREVE